jgi:hypothetical protein
MSARNVKIILVIVGIIAFAVYTWFPLQTTFNGASFASPDETANYFWIERVAHGEALSYSEPLNVIANDVIVPRSVRSDNGEVKPVSFLGIILIYGAIAKFLGMWIVPLLTPLFAVLGVLFFYGIVKKIFDEKTAFFSALMLFALAPYWYYASRGLFHNILFIDLVLAGIYLLTMNGTRIERMKRINANFVFMFLAGICFGLAIMTRTSELIWLAPAGLIIAAAYWQKINWRKAMLFALGLFLALVPMLYYNNALYGGTFNFGYGQKEKTVVQFTDDGLAAPLNQSVAMTNAILPFGFHPRAVWNNFINYYVKIFWYLFWPALLGGILYLWKWKEKSRAQKLYFEIFVLTSVILGGYYGSWHIQDSIALNPVTIGNSYTRYWLPMYILSLPLAAEFILWLGSELQTLAHARQFATLLCIIFVALNFQTAVFGKDEGLYYTAQNITLDKARAEQVLTSVPDNAVIATKYFDKYLWPERKVISTDLSDETKNQAIAALLKNNVPVYYYGFIFTNEDLVLLNEYKLHQVGLNITPTEIYAADKLGLYRLIAVQQNNNQ